MHATRFNGFKTKEFKLDKDRRTLLKARRVPVAVRITNDPREGRERKLPLRTCVPPRSKETLLQTNRLRVTSEKLLIPSR
ncbi:hypothetical protein HZH68_003742 [Vespula germanica]|uniref:Uncharacterized protein n=1 Tax=Vespula germanica TaxID=30212 RepID=A0A834NPT6_VESGE|nr:hypothetical protein HZH68_003742 [Vespula germanica]